MNKIIARLRPTRNVLLKAARVIACPPSMAKCPCKSPHLGRFIQSNAKLIQYPNWNVGRMEYWNIGYKIRSHNFNHNSSAPLFPYSISK
jgi:hypothetical protein